MRKDTGLGGRAPRCQAGLLPVLPAGGVVLVVWFLHSEWKRVPAELPGLPDCRQELPEPADSLEVHLPLFGLLPSVAATPLPPRERLEDSGQWRSLPREDLNRCAQPPLTDLPCPRRPHRGLAC